MKCFEGKKVLITGNTGFKGRWLSAALQHLGSEVFGYSLDSLSNNTGSVHFEFSPFVSKQFIGDISCLESVEAAVTEVKPDYVFHLAANAIVSKCFDDPVDAFKTNCLGTFVMLEAVRKAKLQNVDVILITSDKVYENLGWAYGYREIDRLGADDIYAGSKASAEFAISAFVNSFEATLLDNDVRVSVARAGNVYGGGDLSPNRLVPDCFRAWYANEPIHLRSPSSTRPWQHVLDVVRGYLFLAQRSSCANDLKLGVRYNFGPPEGLCVPVEELLVLAAKKVKEVNPLLNTEIVAPVQKKIWQEQRFLSLSSVKASCDLGWNLSLDLESGLALTAEWFNAYLTTGADCTEMQVREFFESFD